MRRAGLRARWLGLLIGAQACLAMLAACSDTATPKDATAALSGGDTTVFDITPNAFSLAARNLIGERRDRFFVGNSIFNRTWVTAPSSTTSLDGLGPTFNARSCSACHFKDGRGAPPQADDEEFLGLLIRLSVPGEDEHGGPLGDPSYGGQLNPRAIMGVLPEATPHVTYADVPGEYADGEAYALRAPTYSMTDLAFGALAENVMQSPRVAPAMIGLGLLEAIDAVVIEDLADEEDADDDGISGRVNRVWDPKTQSVKLGRFGWKANQAGIEQQNSGAFLGDIGITSSLHPSQDCPAPQVECSDAISGGEPEIDDDTLGDVTYYARMLAVPARRDVDDADVRAGEQLFADFGCTGCHLRELHTGELRTGELHGFPELSQQRIHPYTDLLLHDMGPELADQRPDFLASGTEWRTPPLWGLGLIHTVNGHTLLLHDGRARDASEAILWHGGEGETAREAFRTASGAERAQLLRFLESL